MPAIEYSFDASKAKAAMAYVISRLGSLDKIKLIKIIYLADRAMFLKHGRPITGDRQVAMPYGPVPSRCLDLVNGNFLNEQSFDVLHVDDNKVLPTDATKSEAEKLDEKERTALDEVMVEHGDTPVWTLVDFVDNLPEYKRTYNNGTSTTIPYELLLELYGNQDQFRDGRAVISPAIAANMNCPFPRSDSDL